MLLFARVNGKNALILLIIAILVPFKAFAENSAVVTQPEPYYVPHIEFGGYYFSDTPHKAGIARAFIPIGIDDPNHLLYIDARGIVKNGGVVREGNLGLGYRQLNAKGDKIHGIYGFFDRKRTSSGNLFSQLTFGLEYWHSHFFIGGNLYLPIGAHSETLTTSNSVASLSQINPGIYNILVTTTANSATEIALVGADFSLGYQFGENLIAYAGVYHFNSSTSHYSASAVQGPMLNLEYTFYPETNIVFGLLDRITAETQLQYDSVRGTRWYAGLRFSVALGNHAPKGIRRRMVDPAYRDIDVVVSAQNSTSTVTALATNSQGSDLQVNQVSTTVDANALIGNSNVSVIAVSGTITDFNSGNATLATGQTLCGGDYEFDYNGQTLSVQVATNGEVRSVSGSNTLVKVGKNNSIQDITLTMVNPNNTAAGNIAIQADSTVNELGTLVVNNVSSNGALSISRSGSAQSATVEVTNSSFSTPSTWNPAGLPSVGDFVVASGATLNLDINNSTFKANASTAQVIGLRMQSRANNSTINVGNIQNSTIVGTDSGIVNDLGAGVAGGTATIIYQGGIYNNNIASGTGSLPNEIGLINFHFGNNTGNLQFNGGISNNIINATNEGIVITDFNGSGSFVYSVNIAQGINNNTITSPDSVGVSINAARATDTYNIVGMHSNKITTGAASGISFSTTGTTTISVGAGSNGLSAANNNVVISRSGSGTLTVTPGL